LAGDLEFIWLIETSAKRVASRLRLDHVAAKHCVSGHRPDATTRTKAVLRWSLILKKAVPFPRLFWAGTDFNRGNRPHAFAATNPRRLHGRESFPRMTIPPPQPGWGLAHQAIFLQTALLRRTNAR
jgi:hypothetical protein